MALKAVEGRYLVEMTMELIACADPVCISLAGVSRGSRGEWNLHNELQLGRGSLTAGGNGGCH